MESRINTYTYDNGEMERVQTVCPDSWTTARVIRPAPDAEAFGRLASLYAGFIVPRKPEIFGRLFLYCLPDRLKTGLPGEIGGYAVADPLIRATLIFRAGLRLKKDGPRFLTAKAEELYRELSEAGCAKRTDGRLPFLKLLPVAPPGFLSTAAQEAPVRCNASFFTMDGFDLATPFDSIGTPVGLTVENGSILTPPLFHREALLVYKNGPVRVERPELKKLTVIIGGREYVHGRNAVFYERPDAVRTAPGKGTSVLVTGHTVAAVRRGGSAPVPASGFTLYTEESCPAQPGDTVGFGGMEDVLFGIQAGTAAVRNGVPAESFGSPFCNIRRPWRPTYPPSLYPQRYAEDRAPRMAIGADRDGRPVVLWAEGMGKHAYRFGEESRGASLLEMGQFCREAGMTEAVNLDGGGSAQLLVNGTRSLLLSDRDAETDAERERGVPNGIAF